MVYRAHFPVRGPGKPGVPHLFRILRLTSNYLARVALVALLVLLTADPQARAVARPPDQAISQFASSPQDANLSQQNSTPQNSQTSPQNQPQNQPQNPPPYEENSSVPSPPESSPQNPPPSAQLPEPAIKTPGVLPAPKPPTEPPTLTIPRLEHAPALEDFLTMKPEGAGRQMAKVTGFVQRNPHDGQAISESTEAYMGYDQKNIYLVFV
jgi:hypothetical protein